MAINILGNTGSTGGDELRRKNEAAYKSALLGNTSLKDDFVTDTSNPNLLRSTSDNVPMTIDLGKKSYAYAKRLYNEGANTPTSGTTAASTGASSGLEYNGRGGDWVTPINTDKQPEGLNLAPIEADQGVDGQLLDSLRRGILTGSQIQGGVRTFGGGSSPDGRANKNATKLRIGSNGIDTNARRDVKRKKQTNTLGLNLGSSVGLQV